MIDNIVMQQVDTSKYGEQILCPGSIAGVTVYHYGLAQGSEQLFCKDAGYWHILFVLEGSTELKYEGDTYSFSKRGCFVSALDKDVTVFATTDVRFIEIQWLVTPDDLEELKTFNTVFPIVQDYATSPQYRDPWKGENMISRTAIEQRMIPRFALGSVEAYGYDINKPHAHPQLDQFFYSFSECDMDVLIDDDSVPMKGDILMHIPLGSNHGAEVTGNRHMHYLWVDFIFGQAGLDLLDEVHIPTGRLDSL